jgi:protein disulfide-isomerase A1
LRTHFFLAIHYNAKGNLHTWLFVSPQPPVVYSSSWFSTAILLLSLTFTYDKGAYFLEKLKSLRFDLLRLSIPSGCQVRSQPEPFFVASYCYHNSNFASLVSKSMKILIYLTVIATLISGLFLQEDSSSSDVLVGTKENLTSILEQNDYVLVEFYAPWCGHCKRLAPEYEKAATTLKGRVVLVKVDATVENELAEKYDIQGYPTLIFFSEKGKKSTEYDGERTANGIAKWCLKKSGPVVKPLNSKEEIETFLKETEPTVIGFFADTTSDKYQQFVAAANDHLVEDLSFGIVTTRSLLEEYKVTSDAAIRIYKDNEEINYVDEMTSAKIVNWLVNEGFPVFDELNNNVFKRAFKAKSPLVMLFMNESAQSAAEKAKEHISVAKDFKGKVIFAWAGEQLLGLAERWGASGHKFPTAIFLSFKPTGGIKTIAFNEEDTFTSEAFKKFVDECLAGTVKPFRKSEPEPTENKGPVKVVVGKTFESIVFDPHKDVFLEFYAPFCGFCKQLAPIYEELGREFHGIDSVTIAKIDATANGWPDVVDISGFPTLYLFPANQKDKPIRYEGDRSLKDIKRFIKEHASIPFELPEEDKGEDEYENDEKDREAPVETDDKDSERKHAVGSEDDHQHDKDEL